jgi:probable phosphoglycerate mutase
MSTGSRDDREPNPDGGEPRRVRATRAFAAGAEDTVVALIRHGESQSNVERRIGGHTPMPLTALGRRQAERAAAALARDLAPTAVITSDLVRARDTAIPIAAAAGVDVQPDPGLRERSLGLLDGLSFADAEARHPDLFARLRARDASFCPPGGEPVADVYARVASAVDRAVAAHRGGRVVLVSHGIAIFHALCHILGVGSPADRPGVFALVDNGSISTFVRRRDTWLLIAVNDRAHLD